MEITRLTPFPLTFSQGGFDASTGYLLAIMNDHAVDLVEIPVTSDVDGLISTPLPDYFSRYDDEYRAEIYLDAGANVRGDIVWIDTLTIMRPYVDVTTLADTTEDAESLRQYEAVARALINTVTGGFEYKRTIYETVGSGADFLFVPERINKINKVIENNYTVYDAESTDPEWTNYKTYKITPDKSAITLSLTTATGLNKLQSRPLRTQKGGSDSFTNYNTYDSPNFTEAVYDTKTFVDITGNTSMFPVGWDYTLSLDTGWPVIPQDIKNATIMLINDLKCNTLPYANAYMKEYESDQFKIKFHDLVFAGTGNGTVDLILSSYVNRFPRLGAI